MLVLDGNCKNRRDVCAATEAGFVEYPSLPGALKTGCQLTPMRSAQYCYYHCSRTSISAPLALPDPDTSVESHLQQALKTPAVVKFLVAKKVTRKQTYYQVL